MSEAVQVNGEAEAVLNGDASVEISAGIDGVHIQQKTVEDVEALKTEQVAEEEPTAEDKPEDISEDKPEEDSKPEEAEDKPEDKVEEDKPEDKAEEEKPEEKAEEKTEEVNGEVEEIAKVEVVQVEAGVDVELTSEDKKDEDKSETKDEDAKEEDKEADKKEDENEDDKKKLNGTKTPKSKDKGSKASNPNSPYRKILRYFACGSKKSSQVESIDNKDRKSIEGEKSKVCITEASGEEARKIEFGMCVVSAKPEEEGEEDTGLAHFVSDIVRTGVADQFGIRDNDELMMLNYFPISGKSHNEVCILFEEEELPRKTHLLFRRKVPAGKKTTFDYHFVTGDVQQLEHPGEDKPVKDDYHVNNLTHHIVRDTASATIVAPLEKVHVQSTKDNDIYFRFHEDKLSAAAEFDSSDKFVFEMIMRIVIRPEMQPEAVFRHKSETSDNFLFLSQDDKDIKVQEETDLTGNLPKVVSPTETMLVRGISNKAQTYGFESIAERGNYVTIDSETVKVDSIPEGQALADEAAFHFHVFTAKTS